MVKIWDRVIDTILSVIYVIDLYNDLIADNEAKRTAPRYHCTSLYGPQHASDKCKYERWELDLTLFTWNNFLILEQLSIFYHMHLQTLQHF